jgi:hypothetical protein
MVHGSWWAKLETIKPIRFFNLFGEIFRMRVASLWFKISGLVSRSQESDIFRNVWFFLAKIIFDRVALGRLGNQDSKGVDLTNDKAS